jgi:hypothetical protein
MVTGHRLLMFKSKPSETLERPLPNTYWVIPGRLLAGEYPAVPEETPAGARLLKLGEAGIDYFVDLTEQGELPGYSHLLPFRSRYLRCEIADTWIPNNVSQMRGLLSDIRAALAAGRRVYVHCRAGIGRTGMVIGCFLAEESGDGKGALKLLNRLWLQSDRSKTWPKVPQTREQADYIRHWPKLAKRTP